MWRNDLAKPTASFIPKYQGSCWSRHVYFLLTWQNMVEHKDIVSSLRISLLSIPFCLLTQRNCLEKSFANHTYLTSKPFLSVVSRTRHISRVWDELGKTTQFQRGSDQCWGYEVIYKERTIVRQEHAAETELKRPRVEAREKNADFNIGILHTVLQLSTYASLLWNSGIFPPKVKWNKASALKQRKKILFRP